MSTQRHSFHLVDPSPWPLFVSLSALSMTTGLVMWFHLYIGGALIAFIGLLSLLFNSFFWWRDIVREATFEGQHTQMVQKGLRVGMLLFVVSEVMFFFGFFWAFFHAALVPTPEVGSVWPPKGITVFTPWDIPLLNTIILLTSGATCTWCHHSILCGNRENAILSLSLTIFLAIIFSGFQLYEYKHATFTMSDSTYGSLFFMATGFHGFHVQIGTIFLFIALIRLAQNHFSRIHHFGFEAASWYWHFVDVVWLFLFISVYWWGGLCQSQSLI